MVSRAGSPAAEASGGPDDRRDTLRRMTYQPLVSCCTTCSTVLYYEEKNFMKRIPLFLFSAALLVVLLGTTAFIGLRTTSAHATQHSVAQATCSGNGCNGKDPEATGCYVGAYTVQTATLSNIFVQLRYSPRCGTNWGRVLSRIGSGRILVQVQRIDGLSYSRTAVATLLFSQMVYAPVLRARACGRIGAGASPFGCTAFV